MTSSTIKGSSVTEFKKIIEEKLGRPLNGTDVAVSHDTPTYSDNFNVSKIDNKNLVEVANNFAQELLGRSLESGDVAVVTANDMANEHQTGNNNKRKIK